MTLGPTFAHHDRIAKAKVGTYGSAGALISRRYQQAQAVPNPYLPWPPVPGEWVDVDGDRYMERQVPQNEYGQFFMRVVETYGPGED